MHLADAFVRTCELAWAVLLVQRGKKARDDLVVWL